MFQTKEQNKVLEEKLKKTVISDLSDKEFRLMIIKMFNKIRIKINKLSVNFHKETENIKKN